MINQVNLFIDVTTRRLMRDIFSDLQIDPPVLIQGDTYQLNVYALQPRANRTIGRVFDFVPLPATMFAAIGPVGEVPELGTFKLEYDGDTTTALAYNATAAQVAAALNALASVTTAGGVTVAGPDGGPWQVAFVTAGAKETIAGDTDNLFPLTSANIYVAREGATGVNEIQLISLDRQSAALATGFTDTPAATATVTRIQAGDTGIPEVQRISISPDAFDGGFSIEFDSVSSAIIPYDADAETVQATLVAMSTVGTGNAVVTGQSPNWDVTFQGDLDGAQDLMTADAAGLIIPVGKTTTWTLATAGVESLVAGVEFAVTKLEVSGVIDGGHATILQTNVTVLNDGIQNAPQQGPTLPDFPTATLDEDGDFILLSFGGNTFKIPVVRVV
jgi:hypothetical protein